MVAYIQRPVNPKHLGAFPLFLLSSLLSFTGVKVREDQLKKVWVGVVCVQCGKKGGEGCVGRSKRGSDAGELKASQSQEPGEVVPPSC